MARAYLDHASTSPIRPEALAAMVDVLERQGIGDPGRVHSEGRASRVVVEEAREQVASLLGARSREVVFTSGGTEAINAAVHGVMATRPSGVVVSSGVEHSSVRDASARYQVAEVAVDRTGRVDVDAVADALARHEVALVHCQHGNHEVGTVQDVAAVAAVCRERGALLHVDACQSAGHVPIDFSRLGADLLSVSAHKLGGPRGIGALLVRRGVRLAPFLVGGAQERARRAGMENVEAIAGFGAAAASAAGSLEREARDARRQTERIAAAALAVEGVRVFGDPANRLPHIVCFGVDGVEAEAVLLGLDQEGVAAHSGSACSSEVLEPSPVLEAMGVDADRSLRVSVGWSTTDDDVARFESAFPRVVERLRRLR